MRETNRTKILVQPSQVLFDALTQKLNSLHYNRDAYLNDIFAREIEYLAKEVKTGNSPDARKKIDASKFLNRQKLTISLDKTVADRIDEVLKDKNISRDSFINRIFFFIVARNSILDKLKIKYKNKLEFQVGSTGADSNQIVDHFVNIRIANSGCFYTLPPFPDHSVSLSIPSLFPLNVVINDDDLKSLSPSNEDFLAELTASSDEVILKSKINESTNTTFDLRDASWRK